MKNKKTLKKNTLRKKRKSQRKSKNTRRYNLKKMTGGAVEVVFETIDNPEIREQVEGGQNIYETVINRLIQTGEAQRFLTDNLHIEQGSGIIDQGTTFEELGDLEELESARFNISFQ